MKLTFYMPAYLGSRYAPDASETLIGQNIPFRVWDQEEIGVVESAQVDEDGQGITATLRFRDTEEMKWLKRALELGSHYGVKPVMSVYTEPVKPKSSQ